MPEERGREVNNRRQEVSVWNWIGTMLLLAIPCALAVAARYLWNVNLMVLLGAVILADILLMILLLLATRYSAKRNALVAVLILTVLCTVVSVLGCAFFGSEIASFVEKLNAPVAAVVTPAIASATPDAGFEGFLSDPDPEAPDPLLSDSEATDLFP